MTKEVYDGVTGELLRVEDDDGNLIGGLEAVADAAAREAVAEMGGDQTAQDAAAERARERIGGNR